MVEAGFMTTFKRGKETHDYKKIEIIYSPFLWWRSLTVSRRSASTWRSSLEMETGSQWTASLNPLAVASTGGPLMQFPARIILSSYGLLALEVSQSSPTPTQSLLLPTRRLPSQGSPRLSLQISSTPASATILWR